ncbi:MAG: MFS transporter [Actinomycetota bacterium]
MAEKRSIDEIETRVRALVPTPRLNGSYSTNEISPELSTHQERTSMRTRIKAWASDANPRNISGRKTPMLIMAFIGLLATWDINATGILSPLMRVDFGFDLGFLVTLTSILSGVALAVSPLTGYIVDRVNRLWLVRIAALVGALSAFSTAGSHSLAMLVASRVVGSVAIGYGGVIGAPILPLASDWYQSAVRARVFGFLNIASISGAVLGPLVAGVLASTLGWRYAYVALGMLLLAALGATGFLREPVRGEMDRLELGESVDEARRTPRPLSFGESWRAARSIATLRRLWYATPFLYIGNGGSITITAFIFIDIFHMTPVARGVIAATGQAAGVALLIVFTPYADRLLAKAPSRVMTIMGLVPLAQAVMFFLIAWSHFVPLSIAFSIVLAMLGATNGVVLFALMSLVTPARNRGLGLQIGNFWQLPGIIIVPAILSYTTLHWSLQFSLVILAPLLVVASIILATGGGGVARDIRAATAAAAAETEAARARAENRDRMLVVRDLDVTYDGTQVLFNVSCDIGEGELVALLGTNGAGKSTLLRAIVGLQEASNGAIFVDGEDVTHAPAHENAKRGIVMVLGGHSVFPTLTVMENLETAAKASALDSKELRTRIEEVLELFPALHERSGQRAGDLSGGEQQMVALGQAFLTKPRLLMIDELSLGLAPAIVDQLVQTVRRIHEQGTTVLLVEQSINVALTIADRAIFMEKGEVRFDGPVSELMRRADLVRAVFMGGALGGGPRRAPISRIEQMPIVRAEHIAVSFGGVHALSDASVEAAAGEIVGIIGPNGAGKTTLFDVIAGHVRPQSGNVFVGGIDVSIESPHARALAGLGRSFQDARLFGSLTVRECIALALERRLEVRSPLLSAVWSPKARKQERRAQRRVEILIRRLGLMAYADKFVSELSTGTRRAVDLACIMAAEPAAVLLDEPSSGLAQAEAEALAPLLTTLVRETGCAMLVIEHDLPLVSSISDRMVAMDLGTTIATGSPDEVMNDPAVVESYLAATQDVIKRSDLKVLAKR